MRYRSRDIIFEILDEEKLFFPGVSFIQNIIQVRVVVNISIRTSFIYDLYRVDFRYFLEIM